MLNIGIASVILGVLGWLFHHQGMALSQLWQLHSFALVFLGTAAATVLQFPMRQCRQVVRWVVVAFTSSPSIQQELHGLLELANQHQLDGVDALIIAQKGIKNSFLKKLLGLVIDGADVSLVKTSGEATIRAIQQRHELAIFFFEQMAKYAPGFGLLGTVVGLIQLLSSLTTPDQLGQGMALALVTTFYGILLANVLFQPMAGRLVVLDQEELRKNEMILIGVLGMVDQEPTLLIKEKMEMVIHNQPVVLA